MKTLFPTLRYFLIILISVICFSCQDQVMDEVSTPPGIEEDVLNYRVEDAGRKGRNTYVLVHGAWHPESCWSDVKWLLERCGHTVVTVQLQGLGADATPVETVTFQDHVNAVKNTVLQQSRPVILVGHSYAGAVISQVGEESAAYIKKLVYISGFMPVNGENVVQLALADTQSLVTQNLIIEGPVAFLTQENYGKSMYNQALSSYNPRIVRQAKQTIAKLRPHPVATLVVPLQLTDVYNSLPKVYISCLKDQAVTPDSQQRMYNRFPNIAVYRIPNSDHSPFITTPVSLVNILRGQ